MALLEDSEIEARLEGREWEREQEAIVREWKVENFAAAIEFVNAVGVLAEAANHHPDILLHGWNNVRLTLSTHSAGGITESDFELAAVIDQLR